MALEIERKFLVINSDYRAKAHGIKHITQGYLCTDPDTTVRVRISDDKAFITIKSRNKGAVRNEWEYQIPLNDAHQLLDCCGNHMIKKTRYLVSSDDGFVWEIDEFGGQHEGLVVAEIELPTEETPFVRPSFVGKEVTGDAAYYNSVLCHN